MNLSAMSTWKMILVLAAALVTGLPAAAVKLEVKPLTDGVWLHTSWQTVATWKRPKEIGLQLL